MSQPSSKTKWGVRKERTPAELNQLCNEFFGQMQLPEHWKFQRYDPTIDNKVVISVGKIYLDTKTQGINLKLYRVYFLTWSELGGVVERSFKDFGKPVYHCLTCNKTPKQLSEYIREYLINKEQEKSNDTSSGNIG